MKTLFEEFQSAIGSGRLSEARALLTTLQPDGERGRRIHGHYQGVILFHQSAYEEATKVMQETLDAHGENVNLLRDLMACQYHTGDMIGFRSNLRRLESLLVEHEAILSPRSLFECELMVGKFLEEDARLAPAILLYERALERAADISQKVRALLQKARWLAMYEPGDELGQLYRELISHPTDNAPADIRTEFQHTLMLIELRLIGSEHAWLRVKRLDPVTYEFDRRLLIFDFFEGALSQDLEIQNEALKMARGFVRLSPFENYLLNLIEGSLDVERKIEALSDLATKLTWASYLRLLCLTANREVNAWAKQELNRKIQLLVRSLDHRSQKLWNLRLKQALQAQEIRIEFSIQSRVLTVQGRPIDLSKKKIGLQLLEGLQKKNPLSVDDAISLLWNCSFSPEHYHRLRMGIHRLNTLVNEMSGLGKIIEVDSQSVRLRPEVRLKPTEQNFPGELVGLF
jgi:hypothetical protein